MPDRDEKGRFLPGNQLRFKAYKKQADVDEGEYKKRVLEAYKEGFIAGLNAQGGVLLPSRKLQIFLSQKGYK